MMYWRSAVVSSDLGRVRWLQSGLRKGSRLTAKPAPNRGPGPSGLHRCAVGTGAAPHVRRPSRDGASAAQPGNSASLPARRKPIPTQRSEEHRVGKEVVSTWRSRWSQYHSKTTQIKNKIDN